MKKLLFLILTISLFACKPINQTENVFDFWWQEMNCKYPFFIEKNIDWDSVYNAYYQQTRNISENELKIVFQEIINLLKDGHCWIETDNSFINYARRRSQAQGRWQEERRFESSYAYRHSRRCGKICKNQRGKIAR